MKTPQSQYLVFTALDGAAINFGPDAVPEILPALELLRSRNIPLIATSMQSAEEVMSVVRALDLSDPFIIENGGAIYVPEGSLKVDFKHNKSINNYRVIELATSRREIRRKLAAVRRKGDFKVEEVSELGPDRASEWWDPSPEQVRAAQTREYGELVAFRGENGDLERFQTELEKQQLRLTRLDDYYLVSGDHDQGSAVRLLLQLYRESQPEAPVISIGLSDSYLGSAMLHAVDIPILVRKEDGRFDEQVGRYGLKFTRHPGPVGWNQAVIALLTADAEA